MSLIVGRTLKVGLSVTTLLLSKFVPKLNVPNAGLVTSS